MKLYFAYGSNMRKTHMKARCPQSRRAGNAVLGDWRWLIAADGYANVVPAAGDSVKGVLYEIGYADEVALDASEEVTPGAFGKRSLPVLFNGRTLLAMVYVNTGVTEGKAEPEYSQQLLSGFAETGANNEYLDKHVRRFLPAVVSAASPSALP
ncbi:MAG: gamma-glutamylcyclotransferase family protein [Pseudomonadota bacterium]